MSDIDVTYGQARVVLSADDCSYLDGTIRVIYQPKHAVMAVVGALRAVGTQEANTLVMAIERGLEVTGVEL
jgi:hypothetical protein